MAAFLDNCRFVPTSGGTSDWTYASTVGGCQSPSQAGAVNGTRYKVLAISADLTQWEISEGAYNSASGTFPRTTVFYNSSGTGAASGQSGAGAKINFSIAPNVAIVGIKEDLISVEEANSFTTTQQAQARRNIAAAASTWSIAVVTATNASWPVPPNTIEMIIEGWGGGASGAGQSSGTQRGAGGGGGAYGYKYFAGPMDSALNITIGAGGSPVSGSAGNPGGATSIIGTNLGSLTAPGGLAPIGPGQGASGGAGSVPTGSWTLSIPGGDGSASSGVAQATYGFGGDAPRGGSGGKANVGTAGQIPGGGGSGENHTGGGSGAGARGQVIIWTR